jgi:predicted nucleic acid-binding protein
VIKESLYLDTSVISNYFDGRDPLIHKFTRDFWTKLPKYRVLISEIVRAEIKMAPKSLSERMMGLVTGFELAPVRPESIELANAYVAANVFSAKNYNDALHAAVATTTQVDYLVSWNFRHFVSVKTKRTLPLVNLSIGYNKLIQIIAPSEI